MSIQLANQFPKILVKHSEIHTAVKTKATEMNSDSKGLNNVKWKMPTKLHRM